MADKKDLVIGKATPLTTTSALVPVRQTALRPASLPEFTGVGEVLAKSGFFPDARTAVQAVVKVMAGAELGLPPIASMTGVYIIKDKVALSAAMMAALIQRSKRFGYRVTVMTNNACEIEFYDRESPAPNHMIGTSTFTTKDAILAGLTTGKNAHTWRQYPRNMHYARAMSNGARWFCAAVFGGSVYTAEELGAQVVDAEGTVEKLPGIAEPIPPSFDSIPHVVAKLTTLFGENWRKGGLTGPFFGGWVLNSEEDMSKFLREEPALWLAGCELLAEQV